MKSWFSITNKADAPNAEILIFDEIGLWGITAKDFAVAFNSIPADREITLGINSPGGEVFQGWAIYNLALSRRDKLTVRIDGVAASIAAVIAMAGKKVVMPPASLLMIHNASGGNWGESEDLRKTAEILDKINTQCVTIFAQRTGKTEDEIRVLMPANKDTWLSPAEAKELGFCDEISGGSAAKAVASFDFRRFKNGPAPVGVGENTPEEKPSTPPNMKLLIAAFMAAGLKPSVEATEEQLVTAFNAEIKRLTDENKNLKDAADKVLNTAAEAAVDAVMVKDDPTRAWWISAFKSDPEGTPKALAAMSEKPTGRAPLNLKQEPKTDADPATDARKRAVAAWSKPFVGDVKN